MKVDAITALIMVRCVILITILALVLNYIAYQLVMAYISILGCFVCCSITFKLYTLLESRKRK
jgi:hypothetical protein